MNYSIIRRVLGITTFFVGIFLLLPTAVGLIYREKQALVYFILALVYGIIGAYAMLKKIKSDRFYAKEGLVIVALSWIVISLEGAIPFVLTGDIPNFTDALFETISGFTTTGSSILSDVEALSHAGLFWRSFSHWVGGMGVIVLILAILPVTGNGYAMHLMRAESPGPSVGKLVPRIKQTAKILYLIYFAITVTEIIVLIISGMPIFDAFCISFGSAGTGGFGVLNDSCGSYTTLQQGIITVFIIMFGVNFSFYFLLLGKERKSVFQMSEVKAYFLIILFSIVTIGWNIRHMFSSLFYAFHHAAFQVGSIITTTGYSTADFDQWPQYSRCLLVMLMFCGACAGSTGGGLKVSRIMILLRSVKREMQKFLHPNVVNTVKMDKKSVDIKTLHGVSVYFGTYMIMFAISVMLIAVFENMDLTSMVTSVAATINNIGPGLNVVGPTCNFGGLSTPAKYVLMFDMLAGRLELYPMLMLFTPSVWRKG